MIFFDEVRDMHPLVERALICLLARKEKRLRPAVATKRVRKNARLRPYGEYLTSK